MGLAPRTLAATDGGDVVRADPRSITIAATEEKIGWIREAAGDRFDSLELNVYPTGSPPLLTDHPRKEAADILDGIRARTGVEVDVDEYLASPQVFIGSVDGLVAKLTELRERLGITSFMLGDVDTLAPVVERLSGTYRPRAREGAPSRETRDICPSRRRNPPASWAGDLRRPTCTRQALPGPPTCSPPSCAG